MSMIKNFQTLRSRLRTIHFCGRYKLINCENINFSCVIRFVISMHNLFIWNPVIVSFVCATGLFFQETQDHSKYALSIAPSRSMVCVGDINKQPSQSNRGGGQICMAHPGTFT